LSEKRSQYDEIGQMDGLRAIFRDFYARVFDDIMIGFLFQNIDAEHLIERESEFVARLLGANEIPYQGRGMRQAHAKHRIMGGQFARRMVLLSETLVAHAVPEAIRHNILTHNETLRPLITKDLGSHCGDTSLARAEAAEKAVR